MDNKIKVEKRIVEKKIVEEKEKTVYITTDGREFNLLREAYYHQEKLDNKEKKEKEYKEFLSTFDVERKPCSKEVMATILGDSTVYNGNNYPHGKDDVGPEHEEVSCQWFNIKSQEDKDKIKKYYKLFFYNDYIDFEDHSGWTLITIYEHNGYNNSYWGCSIYSLEEYKNYIKDFTDNLPC